MTAPLYVVVVQKSTGKWREFSRYVSPAGAQAVAARLRALGAVVRADVLPARDQERECDV